MRAINTILIFVVGTILLMLISGASTIAQYGAAFPRSVVTAGVAAAGYYYLTRDSQ